MRHFILTLTLILIAPIAAHAGMSVCHDGPTVTNQSLRGKPMPGCEYYNGEDRTEYDRVRNLIKTVRLDFLKWTTQLEEMTQSEKDAVDAARQAAQEDSVRQGAKNANTLFSSQGVGRRAVLLCVIDGLNAVMAGRTQPFALADLKSCVDDKIDAGDAD